MTAPPCSVADGSTGPGGQRKRRSSNGILPAIWIEHCWTGASCVPATGIYSGWIASIMPFSGTHNDDDPFVSLDGQWLYFVSDRPSSISTVPDNQNIWRYRLKQPNRLEALSINSSHAEYSPVLTSAGNLYFASARPGGFGQGDLYRAEPTADGFREPTLLSSAVNSANGEWNLWVSMDETEMLLEASSRPTNVSISGDLYYSRLTSSGWSPVLSVTELNSTGSDLLPRLHPDRQTLYFTRAAFGGHVGVSSTNWPELRSKLMER